MTPIYLHRNLKYKEIAITYLAVSMGGGGVVGYGKHIGFIQAHKGLANRC